MSYRNSLAALLTGAALIVTTAGAAVGQDESPPPDASMAPEASPEVEMSEPSTLEIVDVAAAKTAGAPLKGKKLKKAKAKAAPDAARYYIDGMGADDIERIVEMSVQARALAEAGDGKAAQALLTVATLLYRDLWSQAKTDAPTLNSELASFIEAGDYGDQVRALTPYTEGGDGFGDLCLSPGGYWFISPDEPWYCAETGGRPVRVDYSLVDESAENGSQELYTGDPKTADAGGVGIHKITQHKTANEKLAGKKSKQAWAKALQKHGPAIASLYAGGPDATPEQQVVQYVLAARQADEAGDKKAAKSFIQLAVAAYRSGVPKRDETGAYNESIVGLVNEEYAGLPGLELWPPPGMIDVCYTKKGKYVTCVDQASPWECWGAGGSKLERMSLEEAPCG